MELYLHGTSVQNNWAALVLSARLLNVCHKFTSSVKKPVSDTDERRFIEPEFQDWSYIYKAQLAPYHNVLHCEHETQLWIAWAYIGKSDSFNLRVAHYKVLDQLQTFILSIPPSIFVTLLIISRFVAARQLVTTGELMGEFVDDNDNLSW